MSHILEISTFAEQIESIAAYAKGPAYGKVAYGGGSVVAVLYNTNGLEDITQGRVEGVTGSYAQGRELVSYEFSIDQEGRVSYTIEFALGGSTPGRYEGAMSSGTQSGSPQSGVYDISQTQRPTQIVVYDADSKEVINLDQTNTGIGQGQIRRLQSAGQQHFIVPQNRVRHAMQELFDRPSVQERGQYMQTSDDNANNNDTEQGVQETPVATLMMPQRDYSAMSDQRTTLRNRIKQSKSNIGSSGLSQQEIDMIHQEAVRQESVKQYQ